MKLRTTLFPRTGRAVGLIAPLSLAALLGACAADIEPGDDDGGADDGGDDGDDGDDAADGEQRTDPHMTHTPMGDATQTDVDATDDELWVYLDLDEGKETDEDTGDWELAFQRFNIAVNGGVSGSAGVEVRWVEDATLDDFEGIDDVPSDSWITDAADGDDDDSNPDLAFGAWYDYDSSTHILTPFPGVYLVRATEDRIWAVEILDYYNDAGTSGNFSILWKALP